MNWGSLMLVGAGIGAVAIMLVAGLRAAYRRIDQWETLELDDVAEGKFFTLSDGERLHFVASGHGIQGARESESIILIHGLMDSTYSWAKNIDALAQAHRVLAIDLIGFGFSSRMTEPRYSLKYSAQNVREFMDAQGIARATLVGHSLGGAVALQVAHDFPDRVNRLVLIAPGTYLLGHIPSVAHWAARMPIVPRALASLSTTHPRLRMASWRYALGDPAHMDETQVSALVQTARVKGSTDALVAMAASPSDSDLPAALTTITAPTLIIWGDRDSAVPVRHGDRHIRALPNARLVVLEGAGHIPHVERPAEVNRMILDFVRENHADAGHVAA